MGFSTPKASADTVIDSLNLNTFNAPVEVEQEFKKMDTEPKKKEFFVQLRERFLSLDTKVRAQIEKNLDDLRVKKNMNVSLETVKREIDAMQYAELKNSNTAVAPATPAAAGLAPTGIVDGVNNKMVGLTDAMYPKEWTTHMTEDRKKLVGYASVATGAVVAYGAYRFGKWLLGKGKKGAEVAKKESKNAKGGWLSAFFRGATLGLAAFTSVKLYEKYKEIGSLKGLFGRAGESINNGIDRTKKIIRPKSGDEDAEVLDEVGEIIGVASAKKSFGLQYDIADKLGLDSPKTVLTDARALITSSAEVKMDKITDAMQSGDDTALIAYINASYKEGYYESLPEAEQRSMLQAARFIVEFFKKYQKRMEAASKHAGDKSLDDLTIGQALNLVAHLTEGMDTMSRTIALYGKDFVESGVLPDIEQLDFTLFEEKKELFLQNGFEYVFGSIKSKAQLSNTAPEVFNKNCKDVALFFMSNTSLRLKELDAKTPWGAEDDRAKIAIAVRNHVKSGPVMQRLRSALLIPENEQEQSEEDKKALAAMQQLIEQGNMSLSDVYQMYHLLESGSTGPLLTMKLTGAIMKNGDREVAIDRLHKVMSHMTSAMLEKGISVAELAKQMHLSESQAVEFHNLSRFTSEYAGQKISDLWSHINSFRKNAPEAFWITATATGAATGYVPAKLALYTKGRINESQIKAILELGELKKGDVHRYIREYKIVDRLMKKNPSMTKVQAMKEALKRVKTGQQESAKLIAALDRDHVYRWFMRPIRSTKDWWNASNIRLDGKGYYQFARGRQAALSQQRLLGRMWNAGKAGFGKMSPIITRPAKYIKANVLPVAARFNPFKTLGQKLGAAGVVFDTGDYALRRYPNMAKELENETDPLKRAMIEDEIAQQRMSVTFYALFLAAGPIGAVPALANMAKDAARGSIKEGTRYMLETEQDLQHKTPGDILHGIAKSSGGMATMGQSISSVILGDMRETFNDANESRRDEGYRAYFRQIAKETLPNVPPIMLTEEERTTLTEDQKLRRLKIIQEEQEATYVASAVKYIGYITEGNKNIVMIDALKSAEQYARINTMHWANSFITGEPNEFARMPWEDKRASNGTVEKGRLAYVEEMKGQEMETTAAGLNELLASNPSAFNEMTTATLLRNMRHELSTYDMLLRQENLDGWEWTGGEEETRNIARLSCAESLRSAILQQIGLLKKKSTITAADVESALKAVRAPLRKDGNYYAEHGQKYASEITHHSYINNIFTVGGMMKHITDRTV